MESMTLSLSLMFTLSHLRNKPQSAAVHDALELLGAAMRQHMSLQPPARARLAAVHLAAVPLARKRTALRVHVLRLQMVQQLAAGIVALRAAVPVADADQATVALADARAARRRTGRREANRLWLGENRRFRTGWQRRSEQQMR